jgi:hypothetical protein
VWEVNEVLPEGTIGANTLVLKDSWVDKDRKREEDILQSIRESYEGDGKKFRGNAHLLTCVEGWDVSIDGKVDDTHICLRNGANETLQHKKTVTIAADPLAHKRMKSRHPLVGALRALEQQPSEAIEYSEKVHHRIVFKEVAKAVTELETMSEVFKCLGQSASGKRMIFQCVQFSSSLSLTASTGLFALHSCDWVHRDISPGNILFHNGQSKLADVEYAKHKSDNSQHGMRTVSVTLLFLSRHPTHRTVLFLLRAQRSSCPLKSRSMDTNTTSG